MRISITALFFSALYSLAWGQAAQPVKWTFDSKKVSDNEYELSFTAQADEGWYVYSQFLDDGGPVPTSFHFNESQEVSAVGDALELGEKNEGFDQLFGMKVIKFSGKTEFIQKIKTAPGVRVVKGYLSFMTCNGEICLPPTDVEFNIALP